MAKPEEMWTKRYVASLAPDAASIPAAEKVLKKGGFGTVEATADGRGWWVVCRGLTGTYQVTVRRLENDKFDYRCNCLSYKSPCKHALALLLYLVEHPEMRPEAEAPKVAASDFEGLLRGAFREPEEDTPRLVFADFLEENDQRDRAALIRYQCEYARLKPQTSRAKELKKLIAPLIEKLKTQIEPLPAGMWYEFRRGFIRIGGDISHFADIGSFPVRLTNLFRDGWIETLVTAIPFGMFMYEDLRPLLAQIGELDISSYLLPDEQLIELLNDTADARATGRLARVKVHCDNRKEFDRFLRLERGEKVDLSAELESERHYYNLSVRTFHQLVNFGQLNGARELSLHAGREEFGEAEVNVFLTADLKNLRRLWLQNWTLNRAEVESLVTHPALAKLTTLRLESCGIQAAGVITLVGSPLFTTLKTLSLAGNAIGKRGLETLLKAKVPASLKKLVLYNCRLPFDDEKKLKRKYGSRLEV